MYDLPVDYLIDTLYPPDEKDEEDLEGSIGGHKEDEGEGEAETVMDYIGGHSEGREGSVDQDEEMMDNELKEVLPQEHYRKENTELDNGENAMEDCEDEVRSLKDEDWEDAEEAIEANHGKGRPEISDHDNVKACTGGGKGKTHIGHHSKDNKPARSARSRPISPSRIRWWLPRCLECMRKGKTCERVDGSGPCRQCQKARNKVPCVAEPLQKVAPGKTPFYGRDKSNEPKRVPKKKK